MILLRKAFRNAIALTLAITVIPVSPLCSIDVNADAEVPINEEVFPDSIFRNYVSANFDADENGYLDNFEIQSVREIRVEKTGITDLQGIEYFTAVTRLDCYDNQLTTLDVSKNTALKQLHCDNNKLTTLVVGENNVLTRIYCYNNQLTTLDVSKNTALKELHCDHNKFDSLDLSGNTALTALHCSSNKLTTLDLSENAALEELLCDYNQFTMLDLSYNPFLVRLNCSENQLETLNINNNTALTELYCNNNMLTSLNVSYNTALTYLNCGANQLTDLDLSNNTELTELYCGSNRLESLNVRGCAKLEKIAVNSNNLSELNLDGCSSLRILDCRYNNLTTRPQVDVLYFDPQNNQVLITTQPNDYSGRVGSIATFKIVAAGPGLQYQWQTYCSGTWKNSSFDGSNTPSLYVPVIAYRDGYKFRCVITSSINKSVTSNEATLHVITPVSITAQPQDYTGTIGSTAKFSVSAQGSGLKYQWQTYSSSTWKNSSLPGYNTATLSVPVTVSRNGYKFRCVVTGSSSQSLTSDEATLTVTASTPVTITTQPNDYTGEVGSTATFKVVALGSGLKYQWQTYSAGTWKNSSLSGYNTATLSVPVIQARNGYKFRCVITDAANISTTTNTVSLHVSAVALSIMTQPADYSGPAGSTATFKVVAQGTGLRYQWQTYKAGQWVNSSLSGYNTAILSVPVTQARNGYKFRCVIIDSNNKTVTSNAAVLRVSI